MSTDDVTLYRHPLGTEVGRVELVIPSPEDSDDSLMICRSERSSDYGVIYPISMDSEDYKDLCSKNQLPHAMSCIIESDSNAIQLLETPEDSPEEPPDRIAGSNVRMLRSPKLWTHPWGRCCCIMHDGEPAPVTTARIKAGDVPWWGSTFTPYQLDLIAAVSDPDGAAAMHVLADEDHLCGRCGHEIWVVADEDIPEELPELSDEDFEEPILGRRDPLDDVPWKNKKEAWDIFREDPANASHIESSGLAVSRATSKKQYSTEQAFRAVNDNEDRRGKGNIYTVKQLVYAALSSSHSGTWGDFDLDMVRSVKGLEEVDIPAIILEQADLGDDEAEEVRAKTHGREANTSADDEADVLDDMLGDEDPDDDDFVEPETSPRPRRPRPRRKNASNNQDLLESAKTLQRALGDFIRDLQEHGG